MNELDRKILELKGFERRDYGAWLPKDSQQEGFILDPDAPIWSTSDAKALELVDEMTGSFLFGLDLCADGIRWIADFNPTERPTPGIGFVGTADSRPEAICRAYIAAMEWMKEKKG